MAVPHVVDITPGVACRLRRLRDLLRSAGPAPFVGCLSNEEIDRLAA
jgi:hypothetical protein